MANDGLLLLLALMTLLLVMFLYAVITLPPRDAVRAEPPVLNRPAPAPPPQASPRSQIHAAATAAEGRRGRTAGPAGYLDTLPPAPSGVPRRGVSGSPPWEPAPRPPHWQR